MRKRKPKTAAEFGKLGAEKRWGKREKTKTVRCYVKDAKRLADVAPSAPDAIRKLLDGHDESDAEG